MLRKPARATMLAFVMTLVVAQVAVAGSASADPVFKVPGDTLGNTLPMTVRAGGFTPGQQVNVEQCDGVSPSAIGWDVTDDCDNGASPPPVIANALGVATFVAGGPHSFTPFKGESPSGLFNCLSPNQASPANGLPDFEDCKIRVSSNNSAPTGDQQFINIQLPDAASTVTPDFVADNSGAAGSCSGGLSLATVKTATVGVGITDQTQDLTISSALLKDESQSTKPVIAGTCTGLINSHYAGTGTAVGAPSPLGTLHETKVALKVTGAASCAWNGAGVAADAAAANGYTLSGTIMISYQELNSLGKAYSQSISITLKHDTGYSDVWDVSGLVTKGLSVGAKVAGSVYLDPVAKFGGTAASITSNVGPVPAPIPSGYTGYGIDNALTSAFAGCSDGVANNSSSAAVVNSATVRTTDIGTTTTGSATVLDSAIGASDLGDPVSGTGIPTGSYVGTVTAGTSFLLSSSPTQQINVSATASAAKALKITTVPARNIKAQTGVPSFELGDGTSPLGSPTTGIYFNL